MTRSAEDQARRLLWLFPGWMRADRGEEAVGLVLDQLPAGATGLPARSRWELARAGLHARRRGTPPLTVWFEATRADPRNRRGLVPEPWQPWLRHWVRDPRWRFRFVSSRMTAFILVLLFLWPAGLSSDQSLVSTLVNVLVWAVVWVAFQRSRAPRWRWAVALRNGLVPGDLRPLPADVTQRGFERPRFADRPALGPLVVITALAVVLLGANLVLTGVVSPDQRGPSGPTVGFLVALAQASVVLALVLRQTLRRVGAAEVAAPHAPESSAMVAPLWSRSTRIIAAVAAAFALMWTAGLLLVAGSSGAVMVGAVALGAGAETVAVARRQRQVGRRLGMWEVWPSTGPQPLLLVRADVLEAEGLRGPSARAQRWPGSPA